MSLAHGMQNSLSAGGATPSVSTPVGGVWPMGTFPQGQSPMWGNARTPGGGLDAGLHGGQMLRSDGTLVDGYGALHMGISPKNGSSKAMLAARAAEAMRDSLRKETGTTETEAPPLLRASSSGFVPPSKSQSLDPKSKTQESKRFFCRMCAHMMRIRAYMRRIHPYMCIYDVYTRIYVAYTGISYAYTGMYEAYTPVYVHT